MLIWSTQIKWCWFPQQEWKILYLSFSDKMWGKFYIIKLCDVFCGQYYKQGEVFNPDNKITSHRCTTFSGSRQIQWDLTWILTNVRLCFTPKRLWWWWRWRDVLPEVPLESLVETSWEHTFDLKRPQNDSEWQTKGTSGATTSPDVCCKSNIHLQTTSNKLIMRACHALCTCQYLQV